MASHFDTVAGTILGTILSLVGMIAHWIPVESILQAMLVAFAAATMSFLTTRIWKYLFRNRKK